MKRLLITTALLLHTLHALDKTEEAFTEVYSQNTWGENTSGEGTSGGGSTLKNTQAYRAYLADFLKQHNIRSVVDVGCGDWEFSQEIDWKGITYTGYDVVKPLVEQNQKKFGTKSIKFVHGNCVHLDLPQADLLICKDVLQHLPLNEIFSFLKQLSKYKYCLLVNDIHNVGFADGIASKNMEISAGQYRPIDLTKPPFNLKGEAALSYQTDLEVKQVLLITRTR